MFNTKEIILFLILFILTCHCHSQTGGIIGYNFGYFTTKSTFFDIHEYKMDTQYPESNFNFGNFARGLNIGFRVGDETKFFEILWTNRAVRSNTTDPVESDGDLYIYKVKYRVNTFNIGGAFGAEFVKLGMSVNMGAMRVLKKYDTQESFSSAKWDDFFDDKKEPEIGLGFFIVVWTQPFEFRPYYHMSLFHNDLGVGRSFTFKTSNAGVAVNFIIGGVRGR